MRNALLLSTILTMTQFFSGCNLNAPKEDVNSMRSKSGLLVSDAGAAKPENETFLLMNNPYFMDILRKSDTLDMRSARSRLSYAATRGTKLRLELKNELKVQVGDGYSLEIKPAGQLNLEVKFLEEDSVLHESEIYFDQKHPDGYIPGQELADAMEDTPRKDEFLEIDASLSFFSSQASKSIVPKPAGKSLKELEDLLDITIITQPELAR